MQIGNLEYLKNFLTHSAKQYVWLASMDACISVCQLPYTLRSYFLCNVPCGIVSLYFRANVSCGQFITLSSMPN